MIVISVGIVYSLCASRHVPSEAGYVAQVTTVYYCNEEAISRPRGICSGKNTVMVYFGSTCKEPGSILGLLYLKKLSNTCIIDTDGTNSHMGCTALYGYIP
jgi:hypothetical protein